MLRLLFGSTSPLRGLLQNFIGALAARSSTRQWLNRSYLLLGKRGRRRFYLLFAKIFREKTVRVQPGIWTARFCGKNIAVNLRSDAMWLDWDNALGILGNDIEVKNTYENAILSSGKPDIFCDIGANYGLHSLLFLTSGIPTISFEPNPTCVVRFRDLCSLNGLEPRIEACALGDTAGTIDLWFPARDTWFGTTIKPLSNTSPPSNELTKIEVEQRKLDDFIEAFEGRRLLIKIDAEGAEERVLRGAQRTLAACRPHVLFECWVDAALRRPLFSLLAGYGYYIADLPWDPLQVHVQLSEAEFSNSPSTNFIAIPTENGRRA